VLQSAAGKSQTCREAGTESHGSLYFGFETAGLPGKVNPAFVLGQNLAGGGGDLEVGPGVMN
jgi:hypothetical protein